MKIAVALTLLAAAVSMGDAFDNPGLSQAAGLNAAEKKTLLDEHNRLRKLQAEGKVPGQPAAADMTRLEWNDATAQHAQSRADNCKGSLHGNYMEYGEGQNTAAGANRSKIIAEAFQTWFNKEYPLYKYGTIKSKKAGHYTQIVTSYSHEIGCGANKCPDQARGRVICNFMIGGNIINMAPFQTGPVCSKCPAGFGYCKDSLCTSSRVCNSGDSNCKCKVDAGKCGANGKFDAGKCECKCNTGFKGLNCDEACEDDPRKGCQQRKKAKLCKAGPGNSYYGDMMMNCQAACGLCKAACKDKFVKKCRLFKEKGTCQSNKYKTQMYSVCPKTCGFCEA